MVQPASTRHSSQHVLIPNRPAEPSHPHNQATMMIRACFFIPPRVRCAAATDNQSTGLTEEEGPQSHDMTCPKRKVKPHCVSDPRLLPGSRWKEVEATALPLLSVHCLCSFSLLNHRGFFYSGKQRKDICLNFCTVR